MAVARKPYQGVLNIVRFNWHFYAIAGVVVVAVFLWVGLFPKGVQYFILTGTGLAALTVIGSLVVSFYTYDLSNLYRMDWLDGLALNGSECTVLNISAGFDETSEILARKFGEPVVTVCDFYNPERHSEISIKRARRAYPPSPKTISVATDKLPFAKETFDLSLVMLAAHEIRDDNERIQFFRELTRITKPSGRVAVTEHLRDVNNFLAFSLGFFHFYPRHSWLRTFEHAGLKVQREIRSTPFITTFILEKHGNTP